VPIGAPESEAEPNRFLASVLNTLMIRSSSPWCNDSKTYHHHDSSSVGMASFDMTLLLSGGASFDIITIIDDTANGNIMDAAIRPIIVPVVFEGS
jgi:hypothetical protein